MATEDSIVASGDGSISASPWVRACKAAKGHEKQAFELLLRCNIIPAEEFESYTVSQEQIQERLWTASHMLQHKPLEEWVALLQQTLQSCADVTPMSDGLKRSDLEETDEFGPKELQDSTDTDAVLNLPSPSRSRTTVTKPDSLPPPHPSA